MAETNNNLCAAEIKQWGFIEKLPGIGGKFEKTCENGIRNEAIAMINNVDGSGFWNTNLWLVSALTQVASYSDDPTTKKRALELVKHFERKYKWT